MYPVPFLYRLVTELYTGYPHSVFPYGDQGAMSRKPVKPENITSLVQWGAQWTRAPNVGFDQESREPAVYEADGTTLAKTFPWVREGDVMTILSNPTRFGERAVAAAKRQCDGIHERQGELVAQAVDSLQKAEGILMSRWRAYYATPAEGRAALIPDIIAAERNMQKIEASLGKVKYLERRPYQIESTFGKFHAAHVPAIQTARRGLSVAETESSSG